MPAPLRKQLSAEGRQMLNDGLAGGGDAFDPFGLGAVGNGSAADDFTPFATAGSAGAAAAGSAAADDFNPFDPDPFFGSAPAPVRAPAHAQAAQVAQLDAQQGQRGQRQRRPPQQQRQRQRPDGGGPPAAAAAAGTSPGGAGRSRKSNTSRGAQQVEDLLDKAEAQLENGTELSTIFGMRILDLAVQNALDDEAAKKSGGPQRRRRAPPKTDTVRSDHVTGLIERAADGSYLQRASAVMQRVVDGIAAAAAARSPIPWPPRDTRYYREWRGKIETVDAMRRQQPQAAPGGGRGASGVRLRVMDPATGKAMTDRQRWELEQQMGKAAQQLGKQVGKALKVAAKDLKRQAKRGKRHSGWPHSRGGGGKQDVQVECTQQ